MDTLVAKTKIVMQYQIMLSVVLLLKCNYIYKYHFTYVFISKDSTSLATMNSNDPSLIENALRKISRELGIQRRIFYQWMTEHAKWMRKRHGFELEIFWHLKAFEMAANFQRTSPLALYRQVRFGCSSLYSVAPSKGNIHHAHFKTIIF